MRTKLFVYFISSIALQPLNMLKNAMSCLNVLHFYFLDNMNLHLWKVNIFLRVGSVNMLEKFSVNSLWSNNTLFVYLTSTAIHALILIFFVFFHWVFWSLTRCAIVHCIMIQVLCVYLVSSVQFTRHNFSVAVVVDLMVYQNYDYPELNKKWTNI